MCPKQLAKFNKRQTKHWTKHIGHS